MSIIVGKDITIDFPIFGVKSRSLKSTLINATVGGALTRTSSDKVSVRALDNVSFEFHEGDRVGLIGHNGSGKSTLLRVLAGIYEPSGGNLSVKGQVTTMLDIFLGMDMEASGYENILIRGLLMGVPLEKIRGMADSIADFSGIGDYLHLPMRTYSSGMAMRLAFATTISVDADIILMDEWLSVGDAEFMEKSKGRLDALIEGARIVVIASHDPALIKSQCNRVLKLEHGKITEID
jgi:lipopolysaccharide transport system ATP-binding protein